MGIPKGSLEGLLNQTLTGPDHRPRGFRIVKARVQEGRARTNGGRGSHALLRMPSISHPKSASSQTFSGEVTSRQSRRIAANLA
eukprot:1727483-Pyramimonas_sp.AAC.1